jgi:hypothetical protein
MAILDMRVSFEFTMESRRSDFKSLVAKRIALIIVYNIAHKKS